MESLPLCQVKTATDAQQRQLEDARRNSVEAQLATLNSKLEAIETAIANRRNTPELGLYRKEIIDLQANPALASFFDASLKDRISKAFNGLRLLALDARTGAKQ